MTQFDLPIGYTEGERYLKGYEVAEVFAWPLGTFSPGPDVKVIRPIEFARNNPVRSLYNPYREANLIADFVNTDSTEEGKLKFVGKYGLIFGETDFADEAPETCDSIFKFEYTQNGRRFALVHHEGDSVVRVEEEIRAVCGVLAVMGALTPAAEDEKLARIKKAYEVKEDGKIHIELPHRCHINYRPLRQPTGYSDIPEVNASYQYLRQAISEGLSRNKVYMDFLTLQRTPKSKRIMRPFLTPDTLAGVIWHQVAEKMGGGEQLRQCERCGKWFRAQRRDARTCGDACRQGIRNRRKPKAPATP